MIRLRQRVMEIIAVVGICMMGLLCAYALRPAPGGVVVAAYSTDLTARTPHQRFNARRAAAAVNGTIVPPNGIFSFNAVVQGWSADRGFLKAPVSYDGTLVDDYGGGVCETSTTLYNAALLAGMIILERHPHTFAPSYAPPGRDAAVAYSVIDLRFKNPYPWPITIFLRPSGGRLVCRLQSPHYLARQVALSSAILDRFAPASAPVQPGASRHRSRWHLQGREGVHVQIYRTWVGAGASTPHRELVSDNTYQAISRVRWEE